MPCSRSESRYQTGFGLLEALVSLALIASIGFALLAWIQQSLDVTQRVDSHYESLALERAVLAWSSSLNPMDQPRGTWRYNRYLVSWDATPAGPVTQQSGYPSGVGLYDLAMYDVAVEVRNDERGRHSLIYEVVLQRVGYIKKRSGRGLFGG